MTMTRCVLFHFNAYLVRMNIFLFWNHKRDSNFVLYKSFATSIFVEKWVFNFFLQTFCRVYSRVWIYVFHSSSRIYIPLYFSNTRLYVSNLCATLMPVETGVWDNKERCIGSLWGDQHYELEYNCGRGVTAIYAPFQRRGR